jgi:hypothetical protein
MYKAYQNTFKYHRQNLLCCNSEGAFSCKTSPDDLSSKQHENKMLALELLSANLNLFAMENGQFSEIPRYQDAR